MRYKVQKIKYEGGDDYDVETLSEYHHYQDAVSTAELLYHQTNGYFFISSPVEIWNSHDGVVVDQSLALKISRGLTEAQRYMVVGLVDAGLEANEAQRYKERLEKKKLPA